MAIRSLIVGILLNLIWRGNASRCLSDQSMTREGGSRATGIPARQIYVGLGKIRKSVTAYL